MSAGCNSSWPDKHSTGMSDWPHFIFEMLKSENRPQPLPHQCQFSIHKSFYCDTTQMNVIATRSKSSQHCWWRIKYTALLCHTDFLTVDTAQHPRKPQSSVSLFFIRHTLYICDGKYITLCSSFMTINTVTAELKSSCHLSYTWWFNSWVIKGEHMKNKRAKIGIRRHDSHMILSGSKKRNHAHSTSQSWDSMINSVIKLYDRQSKVQIPTEAWDSSLLWNIQTNAGTHTASY